MSELSVERIDMNFRNSLDAEFKSDPPPPIISSVDFRTDHWFNSANLDKTICQF